MATLCHLIQKDAHGLVDSLVYRVDQCDVEKPPVPKENELYSKIGDS